MRHATPAARHHLQGLDFLRGVAALAVVAFHLESRLNLPPLFWHGYLGVDFFFVLSGFVISHAYARRVASGEMGFATFAVLRAVRLLPLVCLGTALAAIADLFRPGGFSMPVHLADIALALVMGVMCLPTLWPTTLEQTVFPLNAPVWSLFFELTANLCCIPVYRAAHTGRILAFIVAGSLVAITAAILASDTVNLGSVPNDFLLGFPRIAWSFSIGTVLSRLRVSPPKLSKWAYAAILGAVLACPTLAGPDQAAGWDGLFDLVAVCILFPILVLGAAHCRHAGRHSRLSAWSGNISYPLYATHYPLVRVIGVAGRALGGGMAVNLAIAGVATLAMVTLSGLIYVAYDVPIRRWLTARIGARPPGPATLPGGDAGGVYQP